MGRDPRAPGAAPKSEVPSFLLLQRLLKISEVETHSGGKCGKDSPKVGQRPECHLKVCKTRGQMQPCPHPGPAARDARQAPVGTLRAQTTVTQH